MFLGGSGANSEKYMEDFQALVSQGDINSPVSGVALTAIGYVGENFIFKSDMILRLKRIIMDMFI